MIGSYVKQINDLLEKIKQEDKENMDNMVRYVTSTELNVGGQLCRYGEIYKMILESESFDEIISTLETFLTREKYESYEEEIEYLQSMAYNFIKDNEEFTNGREQLLKTSKKYIFDTIINCL